MADNQIVISYDKNDGWDIPCASQIPDGPFPLDVTFVRAPGCTFTFRRITGLKKKQWTNTEAHGNGASSLTITETDASNKKNAYQVVIVVGDEEITSPKETCGKGGGATKNPPMIINE
jgi:hypothetical protein